MTYLPFANHYTLQVTTRTNDNAHHWRNSIDIVNTAGEAAPAYGDPIVTAFVSFIQHCQRDDCELIEVTMRNWARGDVPFDLQAALWLQSVALPCQDYGTGNAFPGATSSDEPPLGEVVALMAKPVFAGTGRTGHMIIRNSIHQGWYTSTAGGAPYLTGAGVDAGAALTTFAASKLGAFVTDAALPRFCLVHYSKKEGTVYETAVQAPVYQRLTTHDMGRL